LQPQPALLNFELRDGVTELETPIDLLQAIVFNEFNPPLQGIAAAQPVRSTQQFVLFCHRPPRHPSGLLRHCPEAR